MQRIISGALLCLAGLALSPAGAGAEGRPLQPQDLLAMKRISEPSLSPDGRWIAFTLATPDERANKVPTDLWIVGADGTGLRRLTEHPAADRHPVWSPDGKWILFESTRSGANQVWMTSPDGREVRQLTFLAGGAGDPVLSPDGRTLAFVAEVYPEFSDRPFPLSDSLNRLKMQEQGPGTPRLFTQLLYRHWDHWVDGKRLHIFIQPFPAGEPRDLTPGDRDAVPSSSTFSAGPDYGFSPDGKEIVYTATPLPTREEAWSTNHNIYVVPVAGGSPRQLTTNPAADASPQYSPDGRYLAYRAQQRPGYEGDRWELMVLDRKDGGLRSLTGSLDQHVGAFRWAPDSRSIYFECSVDGCDLVLAAALHGGAIRTVVGGGSNHAIDISADGSTLFFLRSSAVRPAEVYRAGTGGGSLRAVTGLNDSLLAAREVPAPQSFWFAGDGGTRVHSWLYTPPGFDRTKRYPLIMLVHGGPQGAWSDAWSYRWNPALWAAQGYVVIAPNPRGSTGFGQQFVDGINGDWGGKVYNDLLRGLDTMCTMPFVDSTRKGAAGASFGGYMVNWFLGHTGRRFNALVTHDGVYNFESMYGATDEVWFDEWEHGGAPWSAPEAYARFSPHRAAKEFRTPTLVIHGGRDFRIPETEAMQLFTALQRQGVPSAFLYFPDENHWVLKPANSMVWHRTVFDWMERYVKKGGAQATGKPQESASPSRTPY